MVPLSSARYASQYAWDDAHRVNGHAPNDAWHDARYDARNDDARHDAGNDDARHDDAWNDGVSHLRRLNLKPIS